MICEFLDRPAGGNTRSHINRGPRCLACCIRYAIGCQGERIGRPVRAARNNAIPCLRFQWRLCSQGYIVRLTAHLQDILSARQIHLVRYTRNKFNDRIRFNLKASVLPMYYKQVIIGKITSISATHHTLFTDLFQHTKMSKTHVSGKLLWLLALGRYVSAAAVDWTSIANSRGDRLPDFSFCGYHASDQKTSLPHPTHLPLLSSPQQETKLPKSKQPWKMLLPPGVVLFNLEKVHSMYLLA